MKFVSFNKIDKWLTNQGFEIHTDKTLKFFEPLWMERLVYVKKDSKEYYIVDVICKLHSNPLTRTDSVDQLFHGMNVDTIPSVTTIDCKKVRIDFRKKFWKDMIVK